MLSPTQLHTTEEVAFGLNELFRSTHLYVCRVCYSKNSLEQDTDQEQAWRDPPADGQLAKAGGERTDGWTPSGITIS